MAKQRKGVGVSSFATGFAKGASQGLQMGMYRAMQQQKAGETENEKLASALTVFQRSVDKELDPELYAEITRDILFLNTGGASITPDIRSTILEKHKGQMTGAVVAKPPEPEEIEAPEEEYHTFALTGTEDYVTPGRTYRPGERISVKKSDVEAGGLSDSPFQFVGETSTATGVTPKEPGYVLSAKEVGDLKLTMAPPGQVWWMGDDGNPTLKGKAKGVDKALKPVRMEHMISGKAEWFNWDPVQGNFIYQSGAKAGDTLEAEELTNYKPPTANAMAELLRILQGSQPQP